MADRRLFVDQARAVREGEELDLALLEAYLQEQIPDLVLPLTLAQFPGGHSNLTYLLADAKGREMVLRRPPFGANIATAHDMGREYHILSALHPHFDKVPQPLAFDEAGTVLGAPFYLMERVEGIILRGSTIPDELTVDAETMAGIARSLVETVVQIHDVPRKHLAGLGHPEGYVQRQVEGWSQRYFKAKTDEIEPVEMVAGWLADNRPAETDGTLIHNDFKYDNLVLDADDLTQIRAVLDWEMATVGDPLMDLGTTLSYWIDPDDPEEMRMLPLGPTLTPGNLCRREVAELYAELSGRSLENLVFYYVFGLFKTAVIAQQIYARFKAGHTKDPRFASMIVGVHLLAGQAARAIKAGRIEGLG